MIGVELTCPEAMMFRALPTASSYVPGISLVEPALFVVTPLTVLYLTDISSLKV